MLPGRAFARSCYIRRVNNPTNCFLPFQDFWCKLEHMSYTEIKASEIGEYIYCRRAWWLRRSAGHQPLNVSEQEAGVVYHDQHGQSVQRADRVRRLALLLTFLAVGAIVFWLVQLL
jgi:hypothetical protein